MPTVDGIGKKAVVNHHRDVPYRPIHCDKAKSAGDPDAGNLLVQGDNLEALKALRSSDAVGVANAAAGNVLTGAVLDALPAPEEGFTGPRVVCAEGCTVPDDRLSGLGVTFKQIPYQIEGL